MEDQDTQTEETTETPEETVEEVTEVAPATDTYITSDGGVIRDTYLVM